MRYLVEFYVRENGKMPVDEFLRSLTLKQREKIARAIDLLCKYGSELHFPDVDMISGKKYQGLWELRIEFASDSFRIFYYVTIKKTAILLHGIVKKQQKTPLRDLETALNRMKDHIRR